MFFISEKVWSKTDGDVEPPRSSDFHSFHPTDDTLCIFIADKLPTGKTEYFFPVDDIDVSIKDFLNLLGFQKIVGIMALIRSDTPETDALRASQAMMDSRSSITLNSNSMSLYFAMMKGYGILNDAEIALLRKGEPC